TGDRPCARQYSRYHRHLADSPVAGVAGNVRPALPGSRYDDRMQPGGSGPLRDGRGFHAPVRAASLWTRSGKRIGSVRREGGGCDGAGDLLHGGERDSAGHAPVALPKATASRSSELAVVHRIADVRATDRTAGEP